MKLKKIADIERAKEGKVYPKGTVYIQISATRGQTAILKGDGIIEPHYAAIIPKIDIEPVYLFVCVEKNMPRFTALYQTGLNIQHHLLGNIEIEIKPVQAQKIISKFVELFNSYYELEEKQLTLEKDLKKNMLNGMFV